jgi:predicted PurR-regulated permease PerM
MTQPAGSRADGVVFLQRVLIVAVVVVIGLLLWAWRHVLLLVFASILIAVGLDAMARMVTRLTPLNRPWALTLSVVAVMAAAAGSVWLFGAQIGAQASELVMRVPQAWEMIRSSVSATPLGADMITQVEGAVASRGAQGALGAIASLGGWTLLLANSALEAFLVVIGGVFFATDPGPYRNGLLVLFPKRLRTDVSSVLDNSGHALARWLLATLASIAVVAILSGVALWLLGVPAFLALALIAGLSQFLPMIGPLLASIPAMLLALTVSPLAPLWVAAAYFGISSFESNLLTPLIQKKAVSLQPALMLFAIIAMGLLFGPLGALLAIPLTVVVTTAVIRFYVNGALREHEKPPGG